ncbi:MAG: GntR family transcriptional regulator [Ferrovum sp.]|nr:GntR family transcriptional regulator [Ferrovum sp.]
MRRKLRASLKRPALCRAFFYPDPSPVREALYRLQREGYLQVHFRSGWRVLPFDFERFEQLYDCC